MGNLLDGILGEGITPTGHHLIDLIPLGLDALVVATVGGKQDGEEHITLSLISPLVGRHGSR
jgi:hypothetical protein